ALFPHLPRAGPGARPPRLRHRGRIAERKGLRRSRGLRLRPLLRRPVAARRPRKLPRLPPPGRRRRGRLPGRLRPAGSGGPGRSRTARRAARRARAARGALPGGAMSGLASLRENLTTEQRALFDLRLRKKRPDLFRLQPIARRTGDGPSPLTYEQERLWFVQQIFPENGAYNVSNNFHLRGRLELPVLARAVEEIVRRHEILRTSFRLEDDRPVQ